MLTRLIGALKGKSRFFSSVGIYGVTLAAEKAVPILLLPVLTRLLSEAHYGIVVIFAAVRLNCQGAVSMGTPAAVGRAYFDRDREGFAFPCYIFNALLVNAALFAIVAVILVSFKGLIPGVKTLSTPWVLFIPVYVLATTIGLVKAKLWIYQKNPAALSLFRISRVVVEFGLSILLVKFLLTSWEGRVLGIGITELLFCAIALLLLFRQDKLLLRINRDYIKDVVRFGLPLVPHIIGWTVVSTIDRFFLMGMEGKAVTGIYGVGFALASAIVLAASAVDMSAEPIIFEKLGDLKQPTARKLVLLTYLYMVLLALAAFGLWLVAPLALRVLAAEKFHGAQEYVGWLAAGFACLGMYRIFSRFIVYSKKTHLLAYVTVAAGVVAIPANYLLIKLNGPIGAAQATFLAFTICFLLAWCFAGRLYPMPWFSVFRPSSVKRLIDDLRKKDSSESS